MRSGPKRTWKRPSSFSSKEKWLYRKSLPWGIQHAGEKPTGTKPAEFIQMDLRDVAFENEFDVVLNMAEGAIGYLENDAENLMIFDVIARALRPGGKHFMDVCNADHAERFFPKTNWELGDKAIALAQFDLDKNARRMQFGSYDILYGRPAQKPDEFLADSIRLYSVEDLIGIFEGGGM